MPRISTRFLRSARALLLLALLVPTAVLADTVYTRSGTDPNGFANQNVTISKIATEDGIESLVFTNEAGSIKTKAMDDVLRIEVDGEAAFTQAEADFAKGSFAAAATGYRTASSSAKDWIRQRAGERLLAIASKTGDFAGTVNGFVQLVRRDAGAASKQVPATNNVPADQLKKAIAVVQTSVGNATVEQKQVLLPFLASLYTAAGDTTSAAATLDRASHMGDSNAAPGTPAAADNGSGLALKHSEADLALARAKQTWDAKDYAGVISSLNAHAGAFEDAEQRAAALFFIAQAREATAATPEQLTEAALAYMRVVANGKSVANAPVAQALYKTAQIEEKLNQTREAASLYGQVINEYQGSPAATDAQAALTRLKGKG